MSPGEGDGEITDRRPRRLGVEPAAAIDSTPRNPTMQVVLRHLDGARHEVPSRPPRRSRALLTPREVRRLRDMAIFVCTSGGRMTVREASIAFRVSERTVQLAKARVGAMFDWAATRHDD